MATNLFIKHQRFPGRYLIQGERPEIQSKDIMFQFSGWDRLYGSDQGCPRKSDSWDVLHQAGDDVQADFEAGGSGSRGRGGPGSIKMGPRQLSVSSDSRLLEDEIKEEVKVILRPKKPPRPQSEAFLDQVDKRRTKRYSAFGVRHFLILIQNMTVRWLRLRQTQFESQEVDRVG